VPRVAGQPMFSYRILVTGGTGFIGPLVSSLGPELGQLRASLPVRCFAIPMMREVAPLPGLRAVLALRRLFRRERFESCAHLHPRLGYSRRLRRRPRSLSFLWHSRLMCLHSLT
jgi:hypothetical protein